MYQEKEVVNLGNMQRASFFWRIGDVITFLRKEYEKLALQRQIYNFRDWLTYQASSFKVFFITPGRYPREVPWNEIKAVVKEMETR